MAGINEQGEKRAPQQVTSAPPWGSQSPLWGCSLLRSHVTAQGLGCSHRFGAKPWGERGQETSQGVEELLPQ